MIFTYKSANYMNSDIFLQNVKFILQLANSTAQLAICPVMKYMSSVLFFSNKMDLFINTTGLSVTKFSVGLNVNIHRSTLCCP